MGKREEYRESLIDFLVNTPDSGCENPDQLGVRKLLFSSLLGHNQEYLTNLFGGHLPNSDPEWVLSKVQTGGENAEYTEAARGKRCGHILKSGDITFRCKNCSFDDSCILCSKCFDQDQHKDHTIFVSVSSGNSGCCDCGDPEAWKVEQTCKVHSLLDDSDVKGKGRALVPSDVRDAIHDTITIAMNFVCDVLSCSPEHLRLTKSEKDIEHDQANSSRVLDRLSRQDESSPTDHKPLYALCLWNDEKHAVDEVKEVVARACRQSRDAALERAYETDRIGRTVVMQDVDIKILLKASNLIEKIGLSTTIRSARDVSRENVSGIIIAWLLDIGKSSIFGDHQILRDTICEELLASWDHGSQATNIYPGRRGIDTHGLTEDEDDARLSQHHAFRAVLNRARATMVAEVPAPAEPIIDIQEPLTVTDENDNETTMDEEEYTLLDIAAAGDDDDEDDTNDDDMELDAFDEGQGTELLDDNDPLEVSEATRAGYPLPQLPPGARLDAGRLIFEAPAAPQRQAAMLRERQALVEQQEERPVADNSSLLGSHEFRAIPRTETESSAPKAPPPQYWLEVSQTREPSQPYEDVNHPVRLDHLILFDLRLWKQARINLRDLYISTVVTVPHFKRLLGLRFASIYSVLAQLYLVADREPELSIIHLSAQVMPTPSIVEETVLQGNLASNIMALIYCFLTTKQVGLPENVCIEGEMNFDMAAITNRRLFQFIHDFVLILSNDFMQNELLVEQKYTRQFLDLVKLLQGICPYVRATGEHVEYENESWLGANFLIKEMHRVCRKFADAFQLAGPKVVWVSDVDKVPKPQLLFKNLRTVTASIIVNCLGAERDRFKSAEIREPAVFHRVMKRGQSRFVPASLQYNDLERKIIKFDVSKQHVSLHHSLHYLYSWLLDGLKDVPAAELRHHIVFSQTELMSMVPQGQDQSVIPDADPDSYLLALFDYPIRVCVFLAQIKAGFWVRNGHSLRHQMQQYRGTIQRDYAYPRDIFLCQAAMVLCDCERVLLSIVDRYGFADWLARGSGGLDSDQPARLDLLEDMLHLLITLLSDRVALLPSDDQNSLSAVVRRDIINILCFKGMSYSDICSRMGDKHLLEEFPLLLEELASFRPPEGLSDFGTYTLKPEYLLEIDPYLSTFNRSQRDEAENVYKTQASKQSGVPADQIAYQPTLTIINSGLFTNLGDFTTTTTFADLLHQTVESVTYDQSSSRVESVFQMALHLMITALVDHEAGPTRKQTNQPTLAEHLIKKRDYNTKSTLDILAEHLQAATDSEHPLRPYIGCHPKIKSVIAHIHQQQSTMFEQYAPSIAQHSDSDTSMSLDKDMDESARKKAASAARAKRVMEQFKQQQKDFMSMQKIDFGVTDADSEMSSDVEMEEKNTVAPYPSGNCILCQEATNESRLYGTFGYICETPLVRNIDFKNDEHRDILAATPRDLDRSSERCTGVRAALDPDRRQDSSKTSMSMSSGCGHIMHFGCFEQYYTTTQNRVMGQIIRMHPEHRMDRNEFICPLCKALGNVFYPIIWKGKEEAYPGVLQTKEDFETWLPKASTKVPSTDDRELALAMFGQTPGLPTSVLHESCAPMFRNMGQAPTEIHTLRVNEGSRSQGIEGTARGGASSASLSSRVPVNPWISETTSDPLSRAYDRMNMLSSSLRTFSHSVHLLNHERQTLRILSSTLAATITATEISQRGVESTSHLLATIPPPALMHLRVLSETTSSFGAYTQLRQRFANITGPDSDKTVRPLRPEIEISRALWFETPDDEDRGYCAKTGERIFNRENGYEDTFMLMVRSLVTWGAATHIEVMHLVRIAYLRELVKTIEMLRLEVRSKDSELLQSTPTPEDLRENDNDIAALENVLQLLHSWEVEHVDELPQLTLDTTAARRKFMRLVEIFALPFLRKCVILLHIRYGVKFPEQYRDPSQSELSHLTELLGLPNITGMLNMLPPASAVFWDNDTLSPNVDDIMMHQVSKTIRIIFTVINKDDPLLTNYHSKLSAPWTYELVPLPQRYEVLLDAASRQRCPSTGNELTDPCMCLVCGAMFCGQAFCCEKSLDGARRGGCNQHLRRCSSAIGIFLLLRKCAMLYLHNGHGSIGHAPYLDKHGEPDMGLRRNRQLFLNQKRYDALVRAPWLNLGIPAIVSRKLEGEVNNGGWEGL